MDTEINGGYVIISRMAVGNSEFVIGQNENAPAKFVTWECTKGEKNYYWGHYSNEHLIAIEDLCNRALDEIHYLRGLQQEMGNSKNPIQQAKKKKYGQER